MTHAICTFAMLSDRGAVRQANEDACGALVEAGAFVLCDGMGGAAAGEVASTMAVHSFLGTLAASVPPPVPAESARASDAVTVKAGLPRTVTRRPAAARPDAGPRQRLELAVRAANHAIFLQAQKSRELRGMGTTLVALLVHAGDLWLAHVGDSRCYLLRDATLQRLTDDHSLVEEQVRAGVLSQEQAASSPVRNIITRAVGSHTAVEPEIAQLHPQPGDLYLLASDGLTRELDDAEIATLLNKYLAGRSSRLTRTIKPFSERALKVACAALVEAANARGGNDNITVLLLQLR